MKVVISIIVTGVAAYFAESLGPWWTVAVVAFVVAAVAQLKSGEAFLAGFIGIGVMWGLSAGVIDAGNDSILSQRIGELLGGLSPALLIAITGLLGGIVGGMAAFSGASGMRWAIGKPR